MSYDPSTGGGGQGPPNPGYSAAQQGWSPPPQGAPPEGAPPPGAFQQPGYGYPPAGSPTGWITCPNCGVPWQPGLNSCQNCRQVDGLPTGVCLATPGRRAGGYLLDGLFYILTLGIGWLIWWLIVSKDGQTPGKQLLGSRAVQLSTRRKATWGVSVVREILRWLIGVVATWTLVGIVLLFWLFFNKDLQELWDLACGTVVVDDRSQVMLAS